MTVYAQHISKPNDRWDLIAFAFYGDAFLIGPIIEANPSLTLAPILTAGTLVLVPVLDNLPATITQSVPPWKQ